MSIHKTFGTKKLRKYPYLGFFKLYAYYPLIRNIRILFPLDYMHYNKNDAMKELENSIDGNNMEENITSLFLPDFLKHIICQINLDLTKGNLTYLAS